MDERWGDAPKEALGEGAKAVEGDGEGLAGGVFERVVESFKRRDAEGLALALEAAGGRSAEAGGGWLARAWDRFAGVAGWAKAANSLEGLTPVEEAARWRWLAGVELLAPLSGKEELRSALAEAAREGWVEGVRALGEADAPLSPKFSGLSQESQEEKHALRGMFSVGALSLACLGGHADCVEALLELGAPLEDRSPLGTPLGCAIRAGSAECSRLLLEAGAEPGGRLPALAKRATDQGEWVFGGLQPQSPSSPDRPLHWAALLGRSEIALLLLSHGADAKALNGAGQDPLACAMWMLPSMGTSRCLSVEAIEALARAQGSSVKPGGKALSAQDLAAKAAGMGLRDWDRIWAAARGEPREPAGREEPQAAVEGALAARLAALDARERTLEARERKLDLQERALAERADEGLEEELSEEDFKEEEPEEWGWEFEVALATKKGEEGILAKSLAERASQARGKAAAWAARAERERKAQRALPEPSLALAAKAQPGGPAGQAGLKKNECRLFERWGGANKASDPVADSRRRGWKLG